MIRKVFTGVALVGALTLGTAGAAGAATTGSSGSGATHANYCSKHAPKVLAHIAAFDQHYQSWLAKANLRLLADQQQNNQGLVKALEAKMAKMKTRHEKLAARQQKVEQRCPGVTAAPSTTTTTSGS